ncbi:MAG TPA: hypothetical protein VMQ81_02380 [Acidimicrobiia bacterium]|nr:hypothetical protein [Acidimicrobiia bacterium]
MAKTIFKWTTFLAPVVIVAGIAALIYAFASDSHYDPNAVVTDSNGFTSRGAYVTNSAWAWVGGIMIGVGMTALFVGIFGWVFSALWSPTAKALKQAGSALETGPAVATAPAPGVATPGWESTVKSPNAS